MNTKQKLLKSIITAAIGTCAILFIPFIAMMFTKEVNWNIGDFIVMGVLLFTTGLSLVILIRSSGSILQKLAAVVTLGSVLLLVWANLAVGLIGAGPNPGNLMYIGVLAIGIVVGIRGNFLPAGMARASFAVVFSLVLLTTIALLIGMPDYPGSSVAEILGVNGFFAGLFLISGFLYWLVAKEKQPFQTSQRKA